jgi:hypothetical protein
MTPLTAPIQKSTKKRLSLTKVKRERGQSRTVIDTCEDPETKTAARLVRIETGGVDRKTGKPLRFFFEVTAKVPGAEEVTKTFKAERNARLVFLAAKHGVVDLGTRLAALPPKLWRAFRDAGAFSHASGSGPRNPLANGGASPLLARPQGPPPPPWGGSALGDFGVVARWDPHEYW